MMRNFRQTKEQVNEEHFQTFLSLLSEDKDEAAEKYELLRIKLFSFFRWNGGAAPEDLADLTIDRVLDQIARGSVIHRLYSYIFTVAEHLLHETDAKQRKLKDAVKEIYSASDYFIERKAKEESAFEQKENDCLQRDRKSVV